jgi:hypothetical protein
MTCLHWLGKHYSSISDPLTAVPTFVYM